MLACPPGGNANFYRGVGGGSSFVDGCWQLVLLLIDVVGHSGGQGAEARIVAQLDIYGGERVDHDSYLNTYVKSTGEKSNKNESMRGNDRVNDWD